MGGWEEGIGKKNPDGPSPHLRSPVPSPRRQPSLTGEEDVSAVQRGVLVPHLHNPEPQVLEGFADSIDLRAEEGRGGDALTLNSFLTRWTPSSSPLPAPHPHPGAHLRSSGRAPGPRD